MKSPIVRPLYSMLKVSRMTGVDRRRLVGLVEGLAIPTYRGAGRSNAIDDAGLKALLTRLGMTRDQLRPVA